jgi:hypothetical protein
MILTMNSKPDRPELINSMRFFPDWDTNSGISVCGLIEMMYDINELRDGRFLECVEVGSHKGESGLLMSSFPFIKFIHCVDIHPYEEIHQRLSHKTKNNKVKIVTDDSNNYAKQIPDKSIDMVYIDSAHDFDHVTNDLDTWSKKLKPEGFLCGHDFRPCWQGVVKAVENFLEKHNMSLQIYRDGSYMIHWK